MADTGFNPPSLTVSEADGTPRRYAIQELEFPAGTVTVSGNKASIATGGGGAVSDDYVEKTGDTMSGDLEFDHPEEGIILRSSTGGPAAGNPVGLLLALTYNGATSFNRWRLTVDDTGALVITPL